MDYKLLTSCLCCNSTELLPYLNLREQPPCNALLSSPSQHEKFYPLTAQVCKRCFHSQLSIALNPSILYSDYTYRTGVSHTLRQHYQELAEQATDYLARLVPNNKQHNLSWSVLDIGCNDGTLLSYFKKHFFTTFGVDCCRVEHSFIDYFYEQQWNEQLVKQFQGTDIWFDIICGTNVLAHNDYPKEFLRFCWKCLKPSSGIIVLEFPYARELIQHKEFDTIYHEHISYFNVNSFLNLLDETGLYVREVYTNAVHGGSIKFYLMACPYGTERHWHTNELARLIMDEQDAGLNSIGTYTTFQWKVNEAKEQLRNVVQQQREQGRGIVGFGASGKGSVLLNYCDINLDYIVDETPVKIGKYSPGKKIPIVPLSRLQEDLRPLAHLVLSWNCMRESLDKIWNARKNPADTYIQYVPNVAVYGVQS